MIRFIDLGNQIYPLSEDERQFAWWNTIIDQFMTYNHNEVWDTWVEFEHDYREDEKQYDFIDGTYTLERYLGLFPKDWGQTKE